MALQFFNSRTFEANTFEAGFWIGAGATVTAGGQLCFTVDIRPRLSGVANVQGRLNGTANVQGTLSGTADLPECD